MNELVTRRLFLASSAGAIVAASALRAPASPPEPRTPDPLGPVPARTGPLGLRPGTPSRPSQGTVILLDGRTLEASHSTRWRIGPDKALLLAPEPDGTWSVLYAEC